MSDSADAGEDMELSEPDGDHDAGPKQVSDPNYHSVEHTATQTCGWTKNVHGRGTSS